MTDLESRVTAMERDLITLASAVASIATSQTLVNNVLVASVNTIADRLRSLADDGDEWRE